VLLESFVSITILVVIMAALTTFLITATDSTNGQRSRQAAVQVMDTQLDLIAALPAADLPLGRTQALVDAQFAAASAPVTPWLSTMTRATDTRSSTLTLPMNASSTIGGIAYNLATYLGWCDQPNSGSTGCVASGPGTHLLRAVVAVSWKARGCPGGNCVYVDATLLSGADDPAFPVGQAPTAAPLVANPGDQFSAVNDVDSLQLGVQANTGVPPFTWQVTPLTLPAGLTMDPSGLIRGTPTTVQTAKPVTVTVTDAFLRTAIATFNWTVVPPLSASPGNRTSPLNASIGSVTLTASGGSGSYVWTDPNSTLPAGLSLSSGGVVTGTPTTVQVNAVRLVVNDAKPGIAPTVAAFTWTIFRPPTISGLTSPFTTTAGAAVVAQPLSYLCPSANCTYTLSGAPAGVGLATAPGGAGAASVTVLGASGTIYLVGTVTGGAGSYTVSVTPTDNVNSAAGPVATAAWTIRAKPGVTGLTSPFSTSVGASLVNSSFSYTCPTANCTFALSGGPTGVGLSTTAGGAGTPTVTVASASGTLYLVGTVGTITGNAAAYTVSVTPTDNVTSVVGPATTAAWTVFAKPGISGLTATLKTSVGATIADQILPYSCPSSNCTFSVTGTPAGVGLAKNLTDAPAGSVTVSGTSGTLYLRGTIAATTLTGTSTVTLTAKDNTSNTPATSATSTWTLVATMRLGDPGPVYDYSSSSASKAVTYTCVYSTCTIRVSGQPSGIGVGANQTTTNTNTSTTVSATSSSVYVSGKIAAGSYGTYQVTTTITDAAGSTLTSDDFWYVLS
jgi:Putative Ig domain